MRRQTKHVHAKRARQRQVLVRREEPARSQDYDIEDMLISGLLDKSHKHADNGMVVEDLMYNITDAMEYLAYKFGISVGRAVFVKSSQDENVLFEVLEKLGLGRIYYYPSTDQTLIRAHSSAPVISIGRNIHIYECGIVSGYLSALTGLIINTVEKRCRYNSADSCEFVSTPSMQPVRHVAGETSPTKIIDAIAEKFKQTRYSKQEIRYDYHILPMLPMQEKELLGSMSDLLYIIGRRYAELTKEGDSTESLVNIANHFCIRKVEVRRESGEIRNINLKYNNYNSRDAYVTLSSAMFNGFVSYMTNSSGTMSRYIDADGSYTVSIKIQR